MKIMLPTLPILSFSYLRFDHFRLCFILRYGKMAALAQPFSFNPFPSQWGLFGRGLFIFEPSPRRKANCFLCFSDIIICLIDNSVDQLPFPPFNIKEKTYNI